MSLKILYLSSEVSPFSKTGGLGDVSAALPKALHALGHNVMIVTPRYRDITDEKFKLQTAAENLTLELSGISRGFAVRRAMLPGTSVPVLLIEHNEFFDRDGIYNVHNTDFPDNAERYSFFSMAALVAAKALGFAPHVVHANDWPTALAPTYLKTLLAGDPFFAGTKSVYTIHNMAHQGVFPREKLPAIGLDWDQFTSEKLEFFGRVNLMKAGLTYADAITTVSPTYAKEIQTETGGFRLDGVTRNRAADLHGILNGADYEVWSPETDRHIARRYSVREVIAGKRANQTALRKEVALAEDGTPLVALVTRLADQKGLDIFAGAFLELLKMDLSIVVLGEGDAKYQEMLASAVAASRGRLSVKLGFDEALAHRIEAGADMFLMPSRYEPCGLNQLYSLRYGTVPVVRRTGGLADSVVDATPEALASGTATGFMFDDYTSDALLGAMRRAARAFRDARTWEKIVRAGMAQDFSWDASARAYSKLYASVRGEAVGASTTGARPAATPARSAAAPVAETRASDGIPVGDPAAPAEGGVLPEKTPAESAATAKSAAVAGVPATPKVASTPIAPRPAANSADVSRANASASDSARPRPRDPVTPVTPIKPITPLKPVVPAATELAITKPREHTPAQARPQVKPGSPARERDIAASGSSAGKSMKARDDSTNANPGARPSAAANASDAGKASLKKRAKGKDGLESGSQVPNASKGPRIRGARRKES
jgi:starch synthase